MPSSSLNKMTVPLASDQSASTQGMLMPKLKYRFRVMFENLGVSTPTTELTKQVVSIARPNLTFEEIGEQMQKQMDFLEMSSAASGIDYKFLTKLEILDGGNGANLPVVLESWELYGCYLKGADYGPMNYGENGAVEITLTIAYDNANQGNQGGGGIGGVIGRTVNDVVTGIGTGA